MKYFFFQELVKINCFSEVPICLRLVSYMKFTQESENPFLMIIQVEPRHGILLQS